MENQIDFEPASFRDRNSRVFYCAGTVFRSLNEQALKEWEMLSSKGFFSQLMSRGKLVRTERVDPTQIPDLAKSEGCIQNWAAVLKHETIPFISYPYEWPFGMLKDAALLQLELMQAALEEEMILKDASSFNIQWVGACPIFIDIASFERLTPGEPWIGYRQFCQMSLYPLYLQAYKDIPFQSWLRGNIEGIEPAHCINLLSTRDLLRPGVFTHVYLQAKFQAKYGQTSKDIRGYFREAGFNRDLIKINVNRLSKLIKDLIWRRTKSQWSNYGTTHSYTDTDHEMKKAFIREVAASHPWSLVWDLGCNTGTYSRIAAEKAHYVVAMDADLMAIEQFYQELKSEGNTRILPLINNVADHSPPLGWRGLERKALTARGKPELTLCLALIHHLVITHNIPVKDFIEWLSSLTSNLVIEFVTKEDPMAKKLLQNKDDNYTDYEIGYFEKCLSESYHIARRRKLGSGTRVLYYGKLKRRA